MNEYVIVIFGASGDLVKRKLLPALYSLILKYDAREFCIVGAAFDDITSQEILDRAKKYIPEVNEELWQYIAERFSYQTLNFTNKQDYDALKKHIDVQKKQFKLSHANTLIYFATSATFFCDITRLCAESGIAKETKKNERSWTRLVYEKPFGHDLTSAQLINSCIAIYFNEDQVYRIDHYLTKELVSNIALVRFTNAVFEPLWNNRFIDNIQIVLSEQESIGNRGLYYDKFGAISDVMQNHMLELLAIIGMEAPERLSGNAVRDQRVKVLEKVEVIDAFLAQYDTYVDEAYVPQDSKTETFAAAYVRINNERWAGVPFYLKTGKCLNKKETIIHIKFKSVDCLLAKCPIGANVLTIEVSPQAGFSLRLNAKKPGEANDVIPINMDFCHSCIFGKREEQAYETLLKSVIGGEQSVSVRFDEIEAAWRIIDAIKKDGREVFIYACDSDGPKEIEQFNRKHGIRWIS